MNFRRVWRMCPGRWFLPVNVPQWVWWFCEMNSWVSWILQVLFRYMERWRKYHRYSVDIAVIRRVGRYALSQGAFPQVLPWKGWRKTVLLLYPWRFRRSGDSVHHWIENCLCAKQVSGAQGVFCISVWNQVDVWWDFERLRLGLPCLVCLCIVTLRPWLQGRNLLCVRNSQFFLWSLECRYVWTRVCSRRRWHTDGLRTGTKTLSLPQYPGWLNK